MEKIAVILFFALLMIGTVLDSKAQAQFSFTEELHDFGKVKEANDTIWHSFTFKNIGPVPLVINDISTSCECTLADFPKKPIMPGKAAVIKGGYAIKDKEGAFNKALTITANTIPATTVLRIKGFVEK